MPSGTTVEDVQELFRAYGNINNITLTTEGNPDNVDAVVVMPVNKTTANVIAKQMNDKIWKARKLQVTSVLFFPSER